MDPLISEIFATPITLTSIKNEKKRKGIVEKYEKWKKNQVNGFQAYKLQNRHCQQVKT